MNAQEIPESIEWHEGMLLTPQHFHQTAQRHEMLVAYGLSCTPYLWGVREMQFDASLLAGGVVSITALEALMPDGLVIALDEAGDLRLDLKPFAEEMKLGPVPISVVVPARKAVPSQGDLERYVSRPAPVESDEESHGNGNGIPRLRPRLALLAGEVPPKYVGIPLLRVRYENEIFTALPDHPILKVPLRSTIGRLCSSTAQRIREKALYLSERARNPGADPEGTLELENKRLIHSLVAGLPEFEAMLHTGTAHPFPLYLALCSLAGNLAGIGISQIPPIFPPYDHNRPRLSFEEVRSYLFQVIDEGISETWSTFRLLREGDLFRLPAKAGWADLIPWGKTPRRAPMVLALRGPSGSTEKDMLEWGSNCVIGTQNTVRSLVARRILGAPRRHVEALEDLLPGRNTLLFEVEADPEVLSREEDLHIFDRRLGAIHPGEVLLFVRKQF
jgi:type VI secretion system protein ImpJ